MSPNHTPIRVRWRLIVVALLCATLGGVLAFTGLLVVDMSGRVNGVSGVSLPSNIPAPFEDGPGYVWNYNSDGRILGTPYANADGQPQYPSQLLTKDFHPGPNNKEEWHHLWYQLLLLDWLKKKGAYAGQIAAWTTLIVAWIVFAVDYLRHRKKA